MLPCDPVASRERHGELDSALDKGRPRPDQRLSRDEARVDHARDMKREANEALEDPDRYSSVHPVDHDRSVCESIHGQRARSRSRKRDHGDGGLRYQLPARTSAAPMMCNVRKISYERRRIHFSPKTQFVNMNTRAFVKRELISWYRVWVSEGGSTYDDAHLEVQFAANRLSGCQYEIARGPTYILTCTLREELRQFGT